jgi:hypothetical protein
MHVFLRVFMAIVASLTVGLAPSSLIGQLDVSTAQQQGCIENALGATHLEERSTRNIELVEQIGAATGSLVVRPPRAYLVVGMRVQIIDVSDPSRPLLAGESPLLPAPILGLRANDSTLYVLTGLGLHLLDVREGTRLSPVGFLESPSDDGSRLLGIVGDVVYLRDRRGIRIVDVSDRARPVEVGSFEDVRSPTSVLVVGQIMYVSANGTSVVDVSDPRRPMLLGPSPRPGIPSGGSMVIYGETIYFTIAGSRGSTSIVILDVSDPTAPRRVSPASALGGSVAAVDGPYLYTSGSAGAGVFDLANPHEPTRVGRLGSSLAVSAVVDGLAYASGAGISIVDVHDPTNPRPLGSYALDQWIPVDFVLNGSYLYVAERGGLAVEGDEGRRTGGIRILDLADPMRPSQVELALRQRGSVSRIARDGSLGYASVDSDLSGPSRGQSGLVILDLSDPPHPKEIAFLRDVGRRYAANFRARGPRLFADDRIFDVSDPSFPIQVGTIPPEHAAARGMETDGQYMYLALTGAQRSSEHAIRVLDLRDPAAPVQIAEIAMEGVGPLTLAGHHLYMSVERREEGALSYELQVWDVADPAHPSQVGAIPARGYPSRFQVVDGFGVASTRAGLAVYDLRTPAAPYELAFYRLPALNRAVSPSTAPGSTPLAAPKAS